MIPGKLLYTWPGSTYKLVSKGTYGTTYEIGLGREGGTVTEGSTGSTKKVGMAIKYLDGEVAYGTEQKSSYELSGRMK